MSNDKKNIIYTAADIEKYLSGRLAPAQMHEMEKAALDDPFLAEAMEGYEGMKDKSWKEQLAIMRHQVTEAGSEAKVIPMQRSTGRWWKTAAAILVIGSCAVLTFILTRNNSEEKIGPQIAQNITTAPDSGIAKDNTASLPKTESVQPVPSTGKEKDKDVAINSSITQTDTKANQGNGIAAYKQDNTAMQDTTRSNVAGRLADKVTSPVTANSAPANNNAIAEDISFAKNKESAKQNNAEQDVLKRQTAAAISKKEQSLNNYFNAQVVAADNSPLPFTNISIKNENFGTYADVKGNFRLVSADTVLNIEVRSVGYLPRTFSLRSNQPQNKIVLLEDEMAIKDKMVIQNTDISSNRRSRRATLLFDSVVNAEPADGWDNYNTYVANNVDIPDEIEKKDFHGQVEIAFDIKANGTVSNIRVNKSLGPAYDEAAKRLIEQGPQWKVKKGKKTSTSVKVQF